MSNIQEQIEKEREEARAVCDIKGDTQVIVQQLGTL
jgi:hypothetical protein